VPRLGGDARRLQTGRAAAGDHDATRLAIPGFELGPLGLATQPWIDRARDPSRVAAAVLHDADARPDPAHLAVARLGVQGITVTEVTGYGRQRGHAEHYRGAEYQVEFVPKLRVEIVLDDASAEAVVEAITNVCRTGKTGDGKIFLAPVGEAVRIRTRESGAAAA
jgi:nitrogen regulatory protein PII